MSSKKLALVFLVLIGAIVFCVVFFGVAGKTPHSSAENAFIDISANVVFWKIVSFGVLLSGVSFMWGRIVAFLDQRKEKIQNDLDSAEHNKLSSEQLLSEHKKQLSNAIHEANKIVEESKSEARKIQNRILEEAKHSAEKLIEDARREIQVRQQEVLEELKREIGGVSVLIASKIIKQSLNVQDHKTLIRDALSEYQVSPQG